MQTFSFPRVEPGATDKVEIHAACRCGYREVCDTKLAAQVKADAHEARFIGRRAYIHDADAIEVRV